MLLTICEEKNSRLAQVEVDEVFGFMCHVTIEAPPHEAVPGGLFLAKLILNMGRDIFLYVIFLQRRRSTFPGVLVHLLRRISNFDPRLSAARGYRGARPGKLQGAPGGGAGEAQTQQQRQSLQKLWHIS